MNEHQWSAAAHAQEAQDIAAQIIQRRVSEILERRYGADWQRIVIEKMREKDRKNPNPDFKGRILPKPIPGKANKYEFDFIQTIHALNDCLSDLPELRSKQRDLNSVLHSLRKGRNALAHKGDEFDINDAEFAKRHIKNILAVCSILASDNEEDVQAIRRLMERLSRPAGAPPSAATSATAPPGPATSELSDIRAMLEVVMRRLETPAAPTPAADSLVTPGAAATAAPPLAAATSDSETSAPDASSASPEPPARLAAAGREPLVRRRGPIPEAKSGLCLFPIVAEGEDAVELGEIGLVNCSVYTPESRQPYLSRVTGVSSGRSDTYYQVIEDARFGENDSAKATLHTHARMDPGSFSGASFGLAAAFADRSARYDLAPDCAGRHVIATGIVLRDGGGAVGAIDSFHEKLNLLRHKGPARSIFLYPTENDERASADERALMAELRVAGHRLLPVRDLSELTPLFAPPGKPERAAPRPIPTEPPPAPPRPAPERKGPLPPQPARPGWLSRPLLRYLMMSAAGGAALLAVVTVASLIWQEGSPSPEALQRLDDLKHAAQAVDTRAPSRAACTQLVAAAAAFGAPDAVELDDGGRAALAAARRCDGWLAASKARLDNVATARAGVQASGADAASCAAWNGAIAALQPFDGAAPSASQDAALDARCRAATAQSDARLAGVRQALARLAGQAGDLAACDRLRSAFGALSQPDLDRLAALEPSARAVLAGCNNDLAESDLRRAAALAFDGNVDVNDPARISGLDAAFQRLTPADIALIPEPQRSRLTQDAATARRLISASDARLASVVGAYRLWQQAPTASGVAALTAAIQALTSFDRARPLQGEVAAALAAASAQSADAEGRTKRWSRVAQQVAQAQGRTPADYWRALDDAVGRLTAQDRAFATADQRATLEQAQALLNKSSRVPNDFGTIPGSAP